MVLWTIYNMRRDVTSELEHFNLQMKSCRWTLSPATLQKETILPNSSTNFCLVHIASNIFRSLKSWVLAILRDFQPLQLFFFSTPPKIQPALFFPGLQVFLSHHPQADSPHNDSLQFMTQIGQFLSHFGDYTFQGTSASWWEASARPHFSCFKYQWWQRLLAFHLHRSALLSMLWLSPLCPRKKRHKSMDALNNIPSSSTW